MKNTATLGQITKMLSLLEGVPSENVQKALESGLFASVIRTGDLEEAKKRMEREKVEAVWHSLARVTDGTFTGITITVPKDPCGHRSDEGVIYQLRCWSGGKVGYPQRGHVDGGVDLFEIMLPQPLRDCDCCWPDDLSRYGINTRSEGKKGKWMKEVCTSERDGSKYDKLTFQVNASAQTEAQ